VAADEVRGRRARFAAQWRTDYADPDSVALLRNRILLGAMVSSLLALLGALLTGNDGWTSAHTVAYGFGTIFVTAIALLTWYRGSRMGDTAFALLVYSGYPVTGGTLIASDPVVAIPMVALCTMLTTTIAILFVQRSATAYLGIGIAVTTVTAVTAFAPARQGTASQCVVSVLCIVVIGVVMRLVRDFAVTALVRSRQLEATDALTGLQNRRGLERSGADLWLRAARTATPLSALVLDIDHFKRINDEQGHAAGDEVLRQLGELLTGGTRPQDLVARLGGEEFLVLSICSPDSVDVFAERLRRLVETELSPVTTSIGAHTRIPVEDARWPTALWEMVNHADHALYRAKAAGRNLVVATADHDLQEAAAQGARLPAQRENRAAPDGGGRPPVGSSPERRRGESLGIRRPSSTA